MPQGAPKGGSALVQLSASRSLDADTNMNAPRSTGARMPTGYRHQISLRIPADLAAAIAGTAARLGKSQNQYIEDCLRIGVDIDSPKVSAANARHEKEIMRLSAQAVEIQNESDPGRFRCGPIVGDD
jgi:hypothetical protein